MQNRLKKLRLEKRLTLNDLNPAKEDAYERITDMLCEDEDDEDE